MRRSQPPVFPLHHLRGEPLAGPRRAGVLCRGARALPVAGPWPGAPVGQLRTARGAHARGLRRLPRHLLPGHRRAVPAAAPRAAVGGAGPGAARRALPGPRRLEPGGVLPGARRGAEEPVGRARGGAAALRVPAPLGRRRGRGAALRCALRRLPPRRAGGVHPPPHRPRDRRRRRRRPPGPTGPKQAEHRQRLVGRQARAPERRRQKARRPVAFGSPLWLRAGVELDGLVRAKVLRVQLPEGRRP
mmetsp:Transcript_6156/g.17577  ORF Transcript_6156/g.17577 Transcript_6156/m.17577 type:complete len:245 (+) Transcript_6156:54-788(+)